MSTGQKISDFITTNGELNHKNRKLWFKSVTLMNYFLYLTKCLKNNGDFKTYERSKIPLIK